MVKTAITHSEATVRRRTSTGHGAKRALLVLAGGLSGLLVAGALLFAAATQLFGYDVIEVSSGSMEPLLSRGDLFVTRPIDIVDVEIGDVVLFDQGTDTLIPVTHRVTGIVNVHTTLTDSATGEKTTDISKLLQTQGDANEAPDAQLVEASRLRGILWFRLPGAGRIFGPFGVQQGLLLIALFIGLAWGAYEIVQRRSRRSTFQGWES
jgi:signal peptidase